MKDEHYIHRDINWREFNDRVLAEARDPDVPLLDRIRFLAIFSSNLDEFFRVKVAALTKLRHLKKSKASKWLGYKPQEILDIIYSKVSKQQEYFGEVWREELIPMLEDQKLHVYQSDMVKEEHLPEIRNFFRVHVQGFLNIGLNKKITLKNGAIYLVTSLVKKDTKKSVLGFVNIPTTQLPRFRELSSIEGVNYYISLDDIIRINMADIFSDYDVKGSSYSIKLNRDEDYEIEDEFSGNLVNKIKEKIDKRMEGDPVRFLFDVSMPKPMIAQLQKTCGIDDVELFEGGRYHNLHDYFQLVDLLNRHLPGQHLPQLTHNRLEAAHSVLSAMESEDFMLHYPYHRYDYVLRFFNEAAVDPAVTEIKVTLYRISKKSHIAQALISAAQNGKKVTVFVEVKARYDELNNMQWAREMEKAGIAIIYSIPGLKVHAKIALVIKKDLAGKKMRYAYLATGNFNEKTAAVYADHGLFTTQKEITRELELLFTFFKTRTKSIDFKQLLVAGFNMKQKLIAFIDNEIAWAKKGKPAAMTIKINGLDEQEMIEKLYEASAAGVKVRLIVRAGCSLVPQMKGVSENISAMRLVDMYLEHARVYLFYNNGDERMYLSSADWMNRNLNRRIEVGFPVLNDHLREEVKHMVELQLKDNVKASPIASQGNKDAINGLPVRAQYEIHNWLEKKEANIMIEKNV